MRGAILLSSYWFLLLGALGTFFPFFSLYLRENVGLSGSETGLIMAIPPLVGIVAQPFWGHLADRTGARTRILTTLTFGAAAGYLLVSFANGFWPLVGTMLVLAMCSSSLLPMSVSVTLGSIPPASFGLVRVWGTIGFLATVVAFPALLARAPAGAVRASVAGASEPDLGILLPVTAALCLAAAIVSIALPRAGTAGHRAIAGEWRQLLANRAFLGVLAFMFGSYLFVHGPMVMFPLFVESLGGSVATISRMWIVMLALEIPLVALAGAGLRRLGGRGLLGLGLGSGGLRWLVCGLSDDLLLIYAVQILHGVTVTGLIIGAPLYVDSVVSPRLRSTAQGLLSMVGVSLGGISSSVLAGWLIDELGPSAPALVGGLGAILLTVALPIVVPAARGPSRTGEEEMGEQTPADPYLP